MRGGGEQCLGHVAKHFLGRPILAAAQDVISVDALTWWGSRSCLGPRRGRFTLLGLHKQDNVPLDGPARDGPVVAGDAAIRRSTSVYFHTSWPDIVENVHSRLACRLCGCGVQPMCIWSPDTTGAIAVRCRLQGPGGCLDQQQVDIG